MSAGSLGQYDLQLLWAAVHGIRLSFLTGLPNYLQQTQWALLLIDLCGEQRPTNTCSSVAAILLFNKHCQFEARIKHITQENTKSIWFVACFLSVVKLISL